LRAEPFDKLRTALVEVGRLPFDKLRAHKPSDSHLLVTPDSMRELRGDKRRQ
jgi:hypothetical protein